MSDSKGEMDLKTLLRTMKPKLHDKDLFVFLTIKTGLIPEEIENCSVFSMKEVEGRTFVIPKNIAENHGLEFEYPCRMITLQIHSSLSAVGNYNSIFFSFFFSKYFFESKVDFYRIFSHNSKTFGRK